MNKTAPEGNGEAAKLVNILSRMDDATKRLVLRSLGVQPNAIKKAPGRRNAPNALEVSRQTGGASHADDFEPVPPEGVVEKGPMAVEQWLEAWREGKTMSTGSIEFENMINDAEALADTASE